MVGRKNWLFSGSPRGADASATLYSLVESAKANGKEPHAYLSTLFEELPTAKTAEDYARLAPQERSSPRQVDRWPNSTGRGSWDGYRQSLKQALIKRSNGQLVPQTQKRRRLPAGSPIPLYRTPTHAFTRSLCGRESRS